MEDPGSFERTDYREGPVDPGPLAPIPLPVESPAPWKRVLRIAAVVAGVLVVVGVWAALLFGAYRLMFADMGGTAPPPASGGTVAVPGEGAVSPVPPESGAVSSEKVDAGVAITPDGQWVLAQATDERGFPEVFALRVSDHTLRTLSRYRLLSVERARHRAWVTVDNGAQPGYPSAPSPAPGAVLPTVNDWLDQQWTAAEAWDFEEGGRPQYMGDPFYAPEVSSAGLQATLVASYMHGGSPSQIRFHSEGATRTVDAPSTFESIGWSPSGRYFATVDLVRDTEWARLPKGWDVRLAKHLAVPTLRIYDGATGSVVASSPCLVPSVARTGIRWSKVEDRVYWSAVAGKRWRIESLAPDGRATPVRLPPGIGASQPLIITGRDSRGTLVVAFPSAVDPTKSDQRPQGFFVIGPGAAATSLPIPPSGGPAAFGPLEGSFVARLSSAFQKASIVDGSDSARVAVRVWHAASPDASLTLILDTGQIDPAHPTPVKGTP